MDLQRVVPFTIRNEKVEIHLDGSYPEYHCLFLVSRKQALALMDIPVSPSQYDFIMLNKGYVVIREGGIAIYKHDFTFRVVKLADSNRKDETEMEWKDIT